MVGEQRTLAYNLLGVVVAVAGAVSGLGIWIRFSALSFKQRHEKRLTVEFWAG